MPLYSRMGPYDVGAAAPGRPRSARAGWWSTGRTSRPSCPSTCGRTCSTGCAAPRPRATSGWASPTATSWSRRCSRSSPSRAAATSRDLDDGLPRVKEHWGWNWSRTKQALEYLFAAGRGRGGRAQLRVRARLRPARAGAARPRCSPRRPPPTTEAHLELVRRAARSTGSGTLNDLRDYYRMHVDEVRPAVADAARDRGARTRAGRGLVAAGVPPPRRPPASSGRAPGRC